LLVISSRLNGLKKLNATDEEITQIRQEDRKTQGVRQQDEELAIQSLEESKDNKLYSYASHFSAICDRVYDKFTNFIIYNDIKVVFYGYDIQKVIQYLKQNNIKQNNYYYGGGDFGFVGIKEKILDKNQIKKLVEGFGI